MPKNKKIAENITFAGWAIATDAGIIMVDSLTGDWWLGGHSKVGIGIYAYRGEAIKIARKIRKQRPDLIHWTRTIPVYDCEISDAD
jgi:hypothetical protein